MSMSDCPECWDTPCMCGYGYRDWTPDKLRDLIKVLAGVLETKGVYRPTQARVVELEEIIIRSAGTWTMCTVCGATTRDGEITHKATCALALALDKPREPS